MTDLEGYEFDDIPRLVFVEEALGQNKLDPELIRPYHAEAIEIAAAICTGAIAKYYSGSLEFTRATSKPVAYRSGSHIGLGLTAGPAALFDNRVVEIVELGLFTTSEANSELFMPLAELREDSICTGGIMNPRINRPADLDSFMRGLRYIAKELA